MRSGSRAQRNARTGYRRARQARLPSLLATGLLHLAVLLALWLICTPLPAVVEPPSLSLFDVAVIPLVAPPPPPHRPLPREQGDARSKPAPRIPAPSPAPHPAPLPPAATSALRRPDVLDATLAPDAPMTAALTGDALASTADGRQPASGAGLGGVGSGGDGGSEGDGSGSGVRKRVPLAGAAWIRKPTDREMRAFWPERARRLRISGNAMLSCIVPRSGQPRSCSVLTEAPDGEGFGLAALRMSPIFRIRPVMRGRIPDQIPVRVPVIFDARRRF
jgi:protein TonB